jgi:transposase-like protein
MEGLGEFGLPDIPDFIQGCSDRWRRYFEKAIDQNGAPETVTIDKSAANLAGLHAVNAERETPIKIRQAKYLNNIVEQDHRAIKRRTRSMLGFKDFHCARTSYWAALNSCI